MRSRTARLCALAIASALPVIGVVATTPPATAAAQERVQKCQGERVTIVGRQNRMLTGTPGRDVILTNGAGTVEAKGGPDLICVNRRTNQLVNAGSGDDRVVVTGRAGGLFELGQGRDVFRGGPSRDVVYADTGEYLGYPDPDIQDQRDRIDTAGGSDEIYAGSPTQPLLDVIRTGVRNDVIHAASPRQAPGSAPLDGGAGSDLVWLGVIRDPVGGAWTLDNRQEHLLEDGTLVARWHGLERFRLGFQRDTAEFVGGPADESFALDIGESVHAGGGDDTVSAGVTVDEVELSGGTGRDYLSFSTDWRFGTVTTADLALGRITTDAGVDQPISGFEDLGTMDERVVIIGDDGPNDVSIISCDTTVHAGGGADMVIVRGVRPDNDLLDCQGPAFNVSEIYGEGGDDTLRGGERTDDLIDGGAGDDRGNGIDGDDVCVNVEVARNCSVSGRR